MGLDEVFLSYDSSSKAKTILADKEYEFEIPYINNSVPISASGLVEAGARAASFPTVADRLFITSNHNNEIVPQHPVDSNLKWVCSWLSGSESGNKTWIDAFYNSRSITLDSATTNLFIDEFSRSQFSYLPSTLILNSNIKYKYYHVGDFSYKNYLTSIDSSAISAPYIHINQWNINPLSSTNSNFKGYITDNSNSTQSSSFFILNGVNYITIPSVQIAQGTSWSANLWIEVQDWEKIPLGQVFGNFDKNGFGLVHDSPDICPVFTLIDNSSPEAVSALHLNYKFDFLPHTNLSSQISPTSSYHSFDIILRTADLGFWAIDVYNSAAYKYDINNYLEHKISNIFPNSADISQVEINSEEELFIYSKTHKQIKKISTSGSITLFQELLENYERFEINSQNNLIFSNSNISVIDNEDILWEVFGFNLYKNGRIIASFPSKIQHIACDSSNCIWILHGLDSVSKISQKGIFEFKNLRIGKRSGIKEETEVLPVDQFRYINFIKIPSPCSTLNEMVDVALIIDTRDLELFYIMSDGFLKVKYNLNSFKLNSSLQTSFVCRGDISCYNFLRKFKLKQNNNLSWKFYVLQQLIETNKVTKTKKLYSMDYNPSKLSKGWHMFSLVYDSLASKIIYYVDSEEVEVLQLSGLSFIDSASTNPLCIGAYTLKNGILNKFINIEDQFKFKGKISDLRFYNSSISKENLLFIYKASHPENKTHSNFFTWNIPSKNSSYVENIKHWFKTTLPGSKTNYFNINIHNLPIEDSNTKLVIENAIKANINKVSPLHTNLNNINWI
jgi:hypothetical protein